MNRNKILSKISLILIIAFSASPIFTPLVSAQESSDFSNPDAFGGTFNTETGQFEASNSGQPGDQFFEPGVPIFDYPTTDPTVTSFSDVSSNSGTTEENIQSCMTELVQDSLLNTLSISAGDILGSLGLGEILGDATGAISGAIVGIGNDIGGAVGGTVGDALGNLGGSIGGSLGDAFGDLGGSLGDSLGGLGDSLGGSLGGVTGGIGGGGGTVPVNEDALRSINTQIQQLSNLIKQDTGAQVSKNVGNAQLSLDGITGCLVNKTIEGILHGTLDWVNRGFDGNPVFVDDPERFFGDIADYELGMLLNDISGGLLCSHIDVNLRVDIARNYSNQRYGGNYGRRCTLSDITENVQAFADGDFSQGGWDSWLAYTQNPYNNYYGARLSFDRELTTRITNKQAVAAWELRNTDFLAIKDPQTGETITPGAISESQVRGRLNAPVERLTYADEFDEIMNSLINQFINISIGDIFD